MEQVLLHSGGTLIDTLVHIFEQYVAAIIVLIVSYVLAKKFNILGIGESRDGEEEVDANSEANE